MKRALHDIESILNQRSLNASDLVNVMGKFRIFIESKKEKRRFPTLTLYGDWIAHPKLDRANAINIVKFINNAFCAHHGPDTKYPVDVVIESFQLHTLLNEIKTFAKEYGISISVFDKWENWEKFAWALVYELTDRPISLPDPATNKSIVKHLAEMMDNWEKHTNNKKRNAIVSVKFVYDQNKFKWVLDLHNGAIFIGDMVIISQDMVDQHPINNKYRTPTT